MTALDALLPDADVPDRVLSRRGRLAMLAIGAFLVVFAPVAQLVQPFWLHLVIRLLLFALFALAFDLAFGYTGLPSFGHAAMFGAGGYTVAFLLSGPTTSAILVLPVAFVAGVLVAAFIGWLSVRARGIYFAMLTLIFAQILYIVAFDDLPALLLGMESVTGGDNGIVGIPMYTVLGEPLSLFAYYYLVLALLAISVVAIVRLANSPFGRVLQGVRENEDRAKAIGYDARRYKIIAFSISGGFTALAGAVFVPLQTTAHPQLLHWTLSGEVLIMTLLGGMGTLWGPMLGAALVVFLEDVLSVIEYWGLILGVLYILVVIFAPNGIAGIVSSRWR